MSKYNKCLVTLILAACVFGSGIVEIAVLEVEAMGVELHNALEEGSIDKVIEALKNGATVHDQTAFGITPLHVAAQLGHLEIVRFLLQKGAEMDAGMGLYGTPLHEAARKGHVTVADLLIRSGAKINAVNSIGSTPLYAAVVYKHKGMVDLLVQEGADVNTSINGWERSPLHEAAHHGDVEIAWILLNYGADVSGKGGFFLEDIYVYQTPLEIARRGSHPNSKKMAELIEDQAPIIAMTKKFAVMEKK